MPNFNFILRGVAVSLLFFYSAGAPAQTAQVRTAEPILPFSAAPPSLPSQAEIDAQPALRLPSDAEISRTKARQGRDFEKGVWKVDDSVYRSQTFKPLRRVATAEERDEYRRSLNTASEQFAERVARASVNAEVASDLAKPGQEDRLQELLRQQKAAQKAQARRTETGTAAVPEDALLVFVSFSMPDHVLKALADQARKVGATLVLRGMVDGKLSATQEAALRVNGAGAGWEINPELFTTFDVQTVPAFVLTGDKRVLDEGCAPDDEGMCSNANTFSKVSGNVSIEIALDTMRRRTDVPLIRDLAQRRLSALAKARG